MSRSVLSFLALGALAPAALARTPSDVEAAPGELEPTPVELDGDGTPNDPNDPGQGGPLDVSSDDYATLQDAVDAVASGGTVRIAAGVYRESLVVADKAVVLVGEGTASTRIKGSGTDGDAPVIALVGAASVSLASLTLSHGGYGVSAEVAEGAAPAAVLHAEDLEIELVGRGVYGSFSDVDLFGTTVRNTRGNGLSLVEVDRLVVDGLTVRGAGGVGLLVDNEAARSDGLRLVSDSVFEQNGGGGLEVHGSALPVRVLNCDFDGNRVAGVTLVDVDDAFLYGLTIDRTASVPTTKAYGDGLRVFGSAEVELRNVDVSSSERAGMSAWGCEDDPTRVTVNSSNFDASGGMDVAYGGMACATYAQVAFVVDDGSVSCDGGRCIAIAGPDVEIAPTPVP